MVEAYKSYRVLNLIRNYIYLGLRLFNRGICEMSMTGTNCGRCYHPRKFDYFKSRVSVACGLETFTYLVSLTCFVTGFERQAF